MTLLPAVIDAVQQRQKQNTLKEPARQVCVVAAGGIGDGRGLAAALSLGADGVLVGTRLSATEESGASKKAKERLVHGKGDDTVRTRLWDEVRVATHFGLWPLKWTARTLGNDFSKEWEEKLKGLEKKKVEDLKKRLLEGKQGEEYNTRTVWCGEDVDIIHSIETVDNVIQMLVGGAIEIILRNTKLII